MYIKNFSEWLYEAREQLSVPGWTKITNKVFFNEMKQSKSLFLLTETIYNKPKNYGNIYLKNKITPQKLLFIVNSLKEKNTSWNTVKSVGSNYIRFNGYKFNIFFAETGEKSFYKMKLGNGTCYLYHAILFDKDSGPKIGFYDYDEYDDPNGNHIKYSKNLDNTTHELYGHKFTFYYAE